MQEAERQGRLPLGAFKEVAKQVLQEDQTQWKKTLETYKIEEDTLFSVELQLSCKQPFELSKNRWILPALCISLGHGRTAYLKGKLSSLCSKGLLFWGKESIEDLCKAWPLFLIFLNLPNFQAKKESCLLLMKDHSLKENCFEDPLGLLVNFLDYYEIGLMTPSLILPDWIMAFSDENSEKLQKKMKDSLDPFDPILILTWSGFFPKILFPQQI